MRKIEESLKMQKTHDMEIVVFAGLQNALMLISCETFINNRKLDQKNM